MGIGIAHAVELANVGEDHRKLIVELRIDEGDDVVLARHLKAHLHAGQLGDGLLHPLLIAGHDINHYESFRHRNIILSKPFAELKRSMPPRRIVLSYPKHERGRVRDRDGDGTVSATARNLPS